MHANKIMNRKSLKLAVVFSLTVFLIIALSMISIGFLSMLFFQNDIVSRTRNPLSIFYTFGIVSVLLGTIFTYIGSKIVTAPIVEISEATKEVAKGNFNIKLKADSHSKEINEMAQNFMLMAQELANIETFHSDFINNVSHEFKTPISAIEGYTTLLQNKLLSEEKRNAYTAKILFNTKRLSTLTGNILQLTRLENQEITTKKESFSLDEQIRESILLFEEKWNQKELILDIELEAAEYFGNSDLLSQVWQNLIGNAIKFVADGGSIRIVLKQEPEQINVSVSDNGIGMSDEVKKRAFEKFYQGDTSHSSDGNGLGLALAQRIVHLHDGSIEIFGEEGKGTTFTVSLPIQE